MATYLPTFLPPSAYPRSYRDNQPTLPDHALLLLLLLHQAVPGPPPPPQVSPPGPRRRVSRDGGVQHVEGQPGGGQEGEQGAVREEGGGGGEPSPSISSSSTAAAPAPVLGPVTEGPGQVRGLPVVPAGAKLAVLPGQVSITASLTANTKFTLLL